MFKSVIYKGIQSLKKLYELLDEVYKEAYSQIEKEFNEKVNFFKERNKRLFIKRLTALTITKCYKDTGIYMPEEMAEEFARNMFEEAKKCGDLDILNRLKERK